MFPLHFAPRAAQRLDILCIGAHCDDIEIGCGGTLLALQRHYPRLRLHWLVLTSTAERRAEALRAFEAFVVSEMRGEVCVHDLPDGRLPAYFERAKALLENCRAAIAPDVVFTHHEGDRHQDHALLADLTWQTFRDHSIWAYEIPKYDGDLVTPNVYVPLPAGVAEHKAQVVVEAFASQREKPWFRAENLLALMRLRGLECRADSGYAEGFHCRKLMVAAQPPGAAATNAPAASSRRRQPATKRRTA